MMFEASCRRLKRCTLWARFRFTMTVTGKCLSRTTTSVITAGWCIRLHSPVSREVSTYKTRACGATIIHHGEAEQPGEQYNYDPAHSRTRR